MRDEDLGVQVVLEPDDRQARVRLLDRLLRQAHRAVQLPDPALVDHSQPGVGPGSSYRASRWRTAVHRARRR
ncbi:hypothetical protein ASG23_08410 [Cellulomonas sp. Leaf395]|nr:hypothetical protein ASG23_08410 [Cellulomonas sp. Leaf395]